MLARMTAWTQQLNGSMRTAASAANESETLCAWLSWATNSGPQPPPVSRQYPVCSPAETSPCVARSQLACRPPGARRARLSKPARGAAQRRLQSDAVPHPAARDGGANLRNDANQLMARYERKRRERRGIQRCVGCEHRQVRAAYACQRGLDPNPGRARQPGLGNIGKRKGRAQTRYPSGGAGANQLSPRVPGDAATIEEGSHGKIVQRNGWAQAGRLEHQPLV